MADWQRAYRARLPGAYLQFAAVLAPPVGESSGWSGYPCRGKIVSKEYLDAERIFSKPLYTYMPGHL